MSDIVFRPAGWPRYSRSTPRTRPRRSATKMRRPSSASLAGIGSGSASAGTAPGLVLRPGLVLGSRLVGQLRQVEAVHEISENGQALLVHRRLGLVLVAGLLIRVGNDAGRFHDLLRDEDRALDPHRQRNGGGWPRVEVQVAPVMLHVEAGGRELVGDAGRPGGVHPGPAGADSRKPAGRGRGAA